jgi:cobalamin biosynthesis protein CobT
MRGEKIRETFKAVVALAEALNRLSLKMEILGFNDRLHEYERFGESLSDEKRKAMGGMLEEVSSRRARYNDDGWAVQEASARLARSRASERFLVVLSDGTPEASPAHEKPEYELGGVIDRVAASTGQKLVGLGIGPGTKHVERYYPNSLADVGVEEMAQKLADLIREAIAGGGRFV